MAFFVRAHFYLFVLCLAIHYAESLRGIRKYMYYPSEMYYYDNYDDYDEDIYVSQKYSSFKKKPNQTTWYKVYKHGLAKINITDGTNFTKVGRTYGEHSYTGKLEKLENNYDGATTTNFPPDYSHEAKLDKIRKEAEKRKCS
ncbi:uncharacterized protein LOC111636674 [Centruroides sculpturatus]|uniref:uncharacterized protein LOC111636674 n=1 Tax=Centruroides sculpturatus TaxID=218467 RepID=UPI000C6EC8EF|nr:uncharacterized protein LOC111636674 [Centruroides sculpturatus]